MRFIKRPTAVWDPVSFLKINAVKRIKPTTSSQTAAESARTGCFKRWIGNSNILRPGKRLCLFVTTETAAFQETDSKRLFDEFMRQRNSRRSSTNNADVSLEDDVFR